jgi:2-polyprenyl-3-methyl-5-hydroxy-6-metoxy-1,4-benzoquinol methylase
MCWKCVGNVLEMIYPFSMKVPPDQEIKILDVGCGSGYLTAALGRWLHNLDNSYTGSASSESAVGNGRPRYAEGALSDWINTHADTE